MSDLKTNASLPSPTRSSTGRIVGRWMVTFLGFPAGGFLALLVLGPVDGPLPALLGGLITGAVLGAAQSWGLARTGWPVGQWIAATAIGLALGLGLGAAAVDYDTTITSLAIQGAVTGLAVGTAQAWVLWPRLGRLAFAWPPALGMIWALGWVITTAAGIGVDEQFTIFGSSGAIVVTALTAVLPLMINRHQDSAS